MIAHENKGISNVHLHHSESSVPELPSPSEDLGCFLSTMKFPPHRQHSKRSTRQKLNNYRSVSLFQKANRWSDTNKWKRTVLWKSKYTLWWHTPQGLHSTYFRNARAEFIFQELTSRCQDLGSWSKTQIILPGNQTTCCEASVSVEKRHVEYVCTCSSLNC